MAQLDLVVERAARELLDPRVSWRTRKAHATELASLAGEGERREHAARTLHAVVALETRPAKNRFIASLLRPILITLPVALVITIPLFSPGEIPLALVFVFLIVHSVLAPVLVPGFQFIHYGQEAAVRAEAAKSLGLVGGPESAGALARLALHPHRTLAAGGRAGLLWLLPRLTATDYGRLDADTVPALARLLTGASEPDARTILAAMEEIGDGRAVAAVEWLSKSRTRSEELKAEAARILPILRERQRQAGDPSRMLRPAEPAADGILLRPAQDGGAEETNLLRASDPNA